MRIQFETFIESYFKDNETCNLLLDQHRQRAYRMQNLNVKNCDFFNCIREVCTWVLLFPGFRQRAPSSSSKNSFFRRKRSSTHFSHMDLSFYCVPVLFGEQFAILRNIFLVTFSFEFSICIFVQKQQVIYFYSLRLPLITVCKLSGSLSWLQHFYNHFDCYKSCMHNKMKSCLKKRFIQVIDFDSIFITIIC